MKKANQLLERRGRDIWDLLPRVCGKIEGVQGTALARGLPRILCAQQARRKCLVIFPFLFQSKTLQSSNSMPSFV